MNAGREMDNNHDQLDQLNRRVDRLEVVCQDLSERMTRVEEKVIRIEATMVTKDEFQQFTERIYNKLNEMQAQFDLRLNEMQALFDRRLFETHTQFDQRLGGMQAQFDQKPLDMHQVLLEMQRQIAGQNAMSAAQSMPIAELHKATTAQNWKVLSAMLGWSALLLSAVFYLDHYG